MKDFHWKYIDNVDIAGGKVGKRISVKSRARAMHWKICYVGVQEATLNFVSKRRAPRKSKNP